MIYSKSCTQASSSYFSPFSLDIILCQATSPQTGGQQSSGSVKSMKEKPGKEDKEVQETSGLKTAGPEGEITAGMYVFFITFANC